MKTKTPHAFGLAALAVMLWGSVPLLATTYTVTNTNDSGAGSLRQAITDANGNAGADAIHFNIPGSDTGCDAGGVCTIAPLSALPTLTDSVTIDGYTQPGAAVNTTANGTNAVLKIALSGANFGSDGLSIDAANVTIRGLVIGGGFASGISRNAVVDLSSNAKVIGCFIGVHADGQSAWPNLIHGIFFAYTSDITIGGTALADRNLISGNVQKGISVNTEFGTSSLVIQGNLVGTNAAANAGIPNGGNGVSVTSFSAGASITVGGSTAGAGNVISANSGAGLEITTLSGATATVQGNSIGTDASRVHALGNLSYGIVVEGKDVTIGGPAAGQGNTIVDNGLPGIWVDANSSAVATIRGNSMEDNGLAQGWAGLGVDLANDGTATYNDPLDADGFQNFPIVLSATPGAGTTEIQGFLNSKPSTLFTLDFYSNPACVRFPRNFLEGRTYLGSGQVTTDGSGNGTFDVVVPVAIVAGERVTATATNPDGSTSEFSQRLPFSLFGLTSGPPQAGSPITIKGTDFAAGASVTIGGQAATNVSVVNDHTITANTPALAPGAAYDLVVTNTDASTGTLQKAWVADFLDVPSGTNFYLYVTTLVSNAITAGIGNGLYGVDEPTLRQQMAVFILKAKHGLCYTPPPCAGVFTDVPCSSTFAPWIEQMAAEGITGGCGTGVFCPQNPVRRDQMAVFLLKGEHGSTYVPPVCVGTFGDVPCPSPFADWIEQLAAENITGGCGGGNYCPGNNNTRGQMAVFIVKTFKLQ